MSKKKMLVFSFMILVFLCLSTQVCFIPSVNAAESTGLPQKSLSILSDVVGFNTTNNVCSVVAQEQKSFKTLQEEEIECILSSNQTQMLVRCSFVSNRLHQIFIINLQGLLPLSLSALDVATSAKHFLERYQIYTGATFYGELKSMLDTVDVGKNATKVAGNVQVKVSDYGHGSTDFLWTYIDENGVSAPLKNVELSYRNGSLKCFWDNWLLYQVSGHRNILDKQAVAVALKELEGYSWNVVNTDAGNVSVSDFKVVSIGNASLCYLNYPKADAARGSDPFTLYPAWHVPFGFDKVYPGCVTGAYVRVWADNGEAFEVSPMVVDGTPYPAESNLPVQTYEQAIVFAVSGACVVAVCIIGFCCFKSRSSFLLVRCLRKLSLKFGAALICAMIMLGSFSMGLSKVRAISFYETAASAIYSSSAGQIESELEAATDVADMLEYFFSNAGYDAVVKENDTTSTSVLSNAYSMDRGYDNVAVFYHGHMAGPDNYWVDPNNVTYSQINYETTGSTFFAWSWVCESAGNLKNAWTHNQINDGDHCYIGFSGASPLLKDINGSYGCFQDHLGCLGMDFITQFYYWALEFRYSIGDALISASYSVFGEGYMDCPLYVGFSTWWPTDYGPGMGPGWYSGSMSVFGNVNIGLAFPSRLWIDALDNWELGAVNVYVDSQLEGNTNYNYWDMLVSPGYHWIGVDSSASNGDFSYFMVGNDEVDQNPAYVYFPPHQTTEVVAYYFP